MLALWARGRREEIISSMDLLTYKPIYVANVSEDEVASEDNRYVAKVSEFAATEGRCIKICAEIETEMALLGESDEREMFLKIDRILV